MSPLKPDSPRVAGARADIDRRAALKLLSGGIALSLTACGKPYEEIVPYVDMPERLVAGDPLKFATTLSLSGYGRGSLVTSIDGRPIKVEGNPRHPASLGATDVFAEAEIMSLYDPGRSKAPRNGDDIASWDAFSGALQAQLQKEQSSQGAGLRLVTGRVTSPTLLRQIGELLVRYPQARWYRYDSISDDAVTAGATLAFGRPLTALPSLADAAVILALDADPLGPGPQQIVNAHGFAQRRKVDAKPFARLYTVEPDWSLTGANADHRLAMGPHIIGRIALALAAILRGEAMPAIPPEAGQFVAAVAADLKANKSHALVMAGPRQPADIHALCHCINAELNAPVNLIEQVDTNPLGHAATLAALADDLNNGRVQTLLIADANLAYDRPDLAAAIKQVEFSAHHGLYDDETAALCRWHLPRSHSLESWSDIRAVDGTASIIQPLIRPLYDTRTAHDFIALVAGQTSPSSYELVRQTWSAQSSTGDFEGWWRRTLHDGVVANSTAPNQANVTPKWPDVATAPMHQGMTLVLAPDAAVWDGSFANNAWLQECPRPLTKEVWGNSIGMSPGDAARLRVGDGDVVRIKRGEQEAEGPVRVRHGQADGVLAASLGNGRTRAGAIGNGIGFSVAALRTAQSPWLIDNVTVEATGKRHIVPSTQHQFELEGEAKDLLPILSLTELAQGKKPKNHDYDDKPTLMPPSTSDTYAWAMVIDTAACIGCNACVVACQAENNVPVVGPEEIGRGRDMHWLRVDSYEVASGHRPGFQPVPCMHCEHAPCEPVCPVAASVHDAEGLNVQVYNRCIGTRFCQANCPYKVRRFNWFGYADGQEYANLGEDSVTASHNPDVSVRARGVMEKCTYCVQRISRARRSAEKDGRLIAEGEVVTACQSACPTQAIHFGDKNNKSSHVAALRGEPRHYALLGHLGTRPRTTYLATLRNPNPDLMEKDL